MTDPKPENLMFNVLKNAVVKGVGPRVGQLSLPKRKPVDTPNFFGITSRGVIPHVTPDVLSKHTNLAGAYMALEDFIERSHVQKGVDPPIYNRELGSRQPLRDFTATPTSVVTVLGARRHPAVIAPMGNGQNYISMYTSTGFQALKNEDYCRATEILRPDITIPLADLTFGHALPNAKRQLRMGERTEEWLTEFLKLVDFEDDASDPCIFAPLLPVSYPIQWGYLNCLDQDHAKQLSGLAVYDTDILTDLGEHGSLTSLPRLSLDLIASPREILRQVRLGVDIFALPFINNTSDAGIALSFSFPPYPPPSEGVHPLGVNMWSPEHQVSLEPLVKGCKCYTCTKHHRAYLHHLLNAKEMLGWTLIQIHNHHVINDFFAGIRSALTAEPSTFEEDCDNFYRVYELELPKGTGERPRARGYHFKTEAGQPKINRAPWEKYNGNGTPDPALVAEMAGLAVTGTAKEGLETPVIPDSTARELDKRGFAEIDK
ncbi:tRNA-guanine transglycosylase [Xylariaceae sp. FL0662B]|nr:tRNA-guanine transglycosylase [Xylariaceae sp. FL0662B]